MGELEKIIEEKTKQSGNEEEVQKEEPNKSDEKETNVKEDNVKEDNSKEDKEVLSEQLKKDEQENTEKKDDTPSGFKRLSNDKNKEDDDSLKVSLSRFGDFKSEEEFLEKYNKLKEGNDSLSKIQQERDEYLAKQQELQDILEKEKKNKQYLDVDEELLKLNVLKKEQGEDVFNQTLKIMSGSVSDIDMLKIKYKEQIPDMTDDEVEMFIRDEYGINNEDTSMMEDDELKKYNIKQKFAKSKLQNDAKEYKKTLMSKLDSVDVSGIRKQELSDEQKTIKAVKSKEQWSKYNDQIIDMVSSRIKGVVKVDDDLEYNYKLELSNAEKARYIKEIEEVVGRQAIDFNDDNVKVLGAQLRDKILRENLDTVIAKAVRDAIDNNNEEWSRKVNNTDGYKGRSNDGKATSSEKLDKEARSRLGI